jgi:cell division protein FtsW
MATPSRAFRVTAQQAVAPVDAFRRSRGRSTSSWIAATEGTAATLRRIDGWLLATIVGLCAFGLVMVYSASEALGYAWFGNPNYFFERQLIWLLIGAAGMLIAARTDYHRWHEWARPLVLTSLILLLVVLVPHLGSERLGARRWISVGPLAFEPSQVATLVAIVWFSRWITDRGPAVRLARVVTRFGILLCGVLLLIILERDLGSAIVLAAIGSVMLMLGGVRIHHLLLLCGALLFLGYVAIKMEAYRASRLQSFRDPFSDPLNTGFQAVQSLFALGSGGFSGVGLGNSIQKYQWLPEAHSDFIFAIIGEELGLLGALATVGAFFLFVWRGVRSSVRAPDAFGAVMAGGIVAWVGVQAFVNISAVTNVVPITGITLPFISYGGSSLAMTLIAVGVLCNISAQGRRQGESKRAHVDRWRRDGRAPHPRDGGGPGTARHRS